MADVQSGASQVQGEAAEDAAVVGNPVLTGGRYDASPRTLDDGDVGAIALDADGAVQVSDGGNAITVDGTVTVQDGGGAITVDGTVTASNVAGDAADDAADSGNPVKVGGKAVAVDGSDPGSVAEGDRADLRTDLNRRLLVSQMHPNYWRVTGNYSSAQSDTSIKAAPGAGLSLYVTDVVLTTDTAMNIELEEGGTDVIPPMYFAANGGAALHFQTPLKLTANTALTITSSAAGNHSVLVSGFTAP